MSNSSRLNPKSRTAGSFTASLVVADPSLWTRITWKLMFIATRAAMPYGIMVFALCYLMPAIIVLAAICSNLYWVTLVMKLRDLLRGDEEEIAAA